MPNKELRQIGNLFLHDLGAIANVSMTRTRVTYFHHVEGIHIPCPKDVPILSINCTRNVQHWSPHAGVAWDLKMLCPRAQHKRVMPFMTAHPAYMRKCILLKNDGNPISLQERACKETTCPKSDKNESRTF